MSRAAPRTCGGQLAPRPGHRRGPAPGGRRSGCGCCWTCRCRRRWAAVGRPSPAPGRRLVRGPGGALVPAGQPLGRRGLVPPRVVARAPGLDRWAGARADAARGPGRSGRSSARSSCAGWRRPARRPATGWTRREAFAAGGTPASASPAAGRTSRLPKATGLPPGRGPSPSDRRGQAAEASPGPLAHRGDLDQVAAGVVEHRRGHRAHRRRLLGEHDAERPSGGRTRLDVLDRERRVRHAVLDQRRLERPGGRVLVRLQQQLDAVGRLGETTVSQPCSPIGTSFFFTKPRTSV